MDKNFGQGRVSFDGSKMQVDVGTKLLVGSLATNNEGALSKAFPMSEKAIFYQNIPQGFNTCITQKPLENLLAAHLIRLISVNLVWGPQ